MAKKKKATNSAPQSASNKSQNMVVERFKQAKNFRQTDQEDIWKRSYNNWRGKLDKSIYPWRSQLFIPWSFTVVETIIPKVFARDPKWRAIAGSPDFPVDGPAVTQKLLDYDWGIMGMRTKMYDYIKDSLMYSKAWAKVYWCYEVKQKKFMEPVVGKDGVITFQERVESSVQHDDPQVDIVDPFDVYVDPDATCLADATYLIHRRTVPLAKLKENPNYHNIDQIKFEDKPGGSSTNIAHTDLDSETRFQGNTPPTDEYKKLVEILEYWESDRLIAVANQSVVLRDTPNPYTHKEIPFVELDDYRDPHKLYGQSELSVIDPLQREINSIRNQRRDYDNLALNPVIRMVPGTLRNPNSAVMAPGNVWMVTDLNSMDVFTLPQLQGTARDIEQQTASDIQRAVAIDEIGIGLLPEGSARRSATEVVTAQSMAGKRFAVKIALLEESVKRIGQLVFALNQQFISEEKIISVVGENGANQWVKLTPEDIRGKYAISIETGSMLPKDEIAARQEAVQLLQYITPIITPVMQTNPTIIAPIIRMILDTFDLPGKQEILDEINRALGVATNVQQERQAAETANLQAQALGAAQQAVQPAEEAAPVANTAQGTRADQELMGLLQGAQ